MDIESDTLRISKDDQDTVLAMVYHEDTWVINEAICRYLDYDFNLYCCTKANAISVELFNAKFPLMDFDIDCQKSLGNRRGFIID